MEVLYQIKYEQTLREFDTQFPMFLSTRGISREDYQETIHHCNSISRSANSGDWGTSFIIFFVVGMILSFVTCGLFVVIYVPLVFVVLFRMAQESAKNMAQVKRQTTEYLDEQNRQKYMKHGIQLMLSTDQSFVPVYSDGVTQYAQSSVPVIQIVNFQAQQLPNPVETVTTEVYETRYYPQPVMQYVQQQEEIQQTQQQPQMQQTNQFANDAKV